MKNVTILGCTGSIGTSTLDVVRRSPDRYRIFALAAGKNLDLLSHQILEFRPRVVVVATSELRASLMSRLAAASLERTDWPELLEGSPGMTQAASADEVDFVMSAVVGVAGLPATYEAIRRGKTIGLANKEVLVSSGELVMNAVRESGTELLPVDSEHNGAHQCLRGGRREEVERLILTASGGPFRNTRREQLAYVTPEQALNHPTWRMGPRITIDSATMMNKGFEVIEACWLFDFQPRDVAVVVHPQSKVHAMVEYRDGSVIAQVCTTDMRMPIQYALTYPDRCEAPVPRINWSELHSWQFEPPDIEKFPLLRLAYQSLDAGGTAGCTLNAADEIAVDAFLKGEIGYTDIEAVVEETLAQAPARRAESIDEILEIDRESRRMARQIAARRGACVAAAATEPRR